MCLAIIMDLYSRRIVGWHIDKRMTIDLIGKALIKAVNIVSLIRGWFFIVIEALNIPVHVFVKYWKGMACEHQWVT